MGKLIADWMTDGRTEIDHAKHRLRALLSAPAGGEVHRGRAAPRRRRRSTIRRCIRASPIATGRNIRRSPFYEREKELGGYFMELGGWERAHGYAANEHLLEKYGNRVPVRENEWDNRHFWRVSNAEHLAMSEDCGIVNLSHFYMCRRRGSGPCRADGMAVRGEDRRRRQYRQGHLHALPRRRGHGARRLHRHPHGRPLPRDRRRRCRPARLPLHAARRRRTKASTSRSRTSREKYVTIGIWGPNARATLQKVVEDPDGLVAGELPLRGDQADPDRRQERHGLPHLLCRRAGLGTAHGL